MLLAARKLSIVSTQHEHGVGAVVGSGVTIAPILEPALNTPVANARSFFGNHSATVLIAAGKLPDSVRPRNARAILA